MWIDVLKNLPCSVLCIETLMSLYGEWIQLYTMDPSLLSLLENAPKPEELYLQYLKDNMARDQPMSTKVQ